MNGVELFDGRLVGPFVSPGFECIRILSFSGLADINTKEECVKAAVDHIRQVELGIEPLRVVALSDEISREEIDVSVEGDHFLVDRPRLFHQRFFGGVSLRECRRARASGGHSDHEGKQSKKRMT